MSSSHKKKKKKITIHQRLQGNDVLLSSGFQSPKRPRPSSYFSPWEEIRLQIRQGILLSETVTSSLLLTGSPNKAKSQVPTAGPRCGLGDWTPWPWVTGLHLQMAGHSDFLATSSFSSLCPGLSRIKLAINSADLSQQEEQPPFPARRDGRGMGQSGTNSLPSSLGRLGLFIHYLSFIYMVTGFLPGRANDLAEARKPKAVVAG